MKKVKIFEQVVSYEFEVDKGNGDVDFIEVFNLPFRSATKFTENKYPDCNVSFYKEHASIEEI